MFQEPNIIHFFHGGAYGDIIYSLPTVLSYGAKAIIYLKYQRHFDFFGSLLSSQPGIECNLRRNLKEECRKNPQTKYISLEGFRNIALSKTSQHLAISHLEALNRQYDLSKQWLFIEPNPVADIIINRTKKYHDSNNIDWSILKPYEKLCNFVGFKNQYEWFVKEFGIDIEFYETNNALDLAKIISGSKLFIGNQSLPFAIAEGLKKPRCLQFFSEFDNCRPLSNNGYITLTTDIIDSYLGK